MFIWFPPSQKSSRKKDKEKQTCKGCNESFNFTKRKHHCKSCGAVRTGWDAGGSGNGAVSSSPTYLVKISVLQAICAKCSKTLDNKTSRVCPECFEASLSLENLGLNEQKRKAVPEVMWPNGETSVYISQNLSFLLPVLVRLSNAVFQIVRYYFKGH